MADSEEFLGFEPESVQIKSSALVARLTKLHGNMVIPCSRCERNADILLFDGDKVATASQLMFFCTGDLSKFLQTHTRLFDQLVLEFGTEELHHMLDIKADSAKR